LAGSLLFSIASLISINFSFYFLQAKACTPPFRKNQNGINIQPYQLTELQKMSAPNIIKKERNR